MPTKPKYDYDIKAIAKLESDTDDSYGLSVRAIARLKGWPETPTQWWIHNNFKKVVRYEPRK